MLLLLGLVKSLDKLLNMQIDVFFEERPFLTETSKELKILNLVDKKKDLRAKKQAIVRQINVQLQRE